MGLGGAGHSRVGAAAPRGGQALALDHLHAQLGGVPLVAQREVHGAAHLHGVRLPGQAQLAAAQLGAGGGGQGGVRAHAEAGEREVQMGGRGAKQATRCGPCEVAGLGAGA